MNHFTVVYDACVLYPAPLRSFLMYLALTGLYRARWTNDIHEEWIRSVMENNPSFTRAQGERVRDLMNMHVTDCLVTGYESLIEGLSLPDPNDRHVLAAAIRCRADVIVTFNLKHFPRDELRKYDVEALDPDDFVMLQFDLAQHAVCTAAKNQRASLKKPAMTADEYLECLERQGLVQTASELRKFASLL
jgi:predicted nucleic acid-binding protein